MSNYKELSPSLRTIMTPGPVEVDPRVLRALSFPILGQFDPEFTSLMNETMAMLRELYMTDNEWCYPVDGTSRSGIEAVLVSLIQPGDKVLIPIYGRFGHLLVEISERCGAEVIFFETEWGTVFDPEEVIKAIHAHKPSLVAMVHGETSTGQMQPLAEIGKACRELDILLVVDAVATIGGTPVETDAWHLDAVMGGTQKCLSVPSGMAPLTYNSRVEKKLKSRKTVERGLRDATSARAEGRTIASNYFDLSQLQDYWSSARLNHHTEATSMLYGLHEGLRILLQEGLDARFQRHRINERALVAGIQGMGLKLYGEMSTKLPVVTCIKIPDGMDGESVRSMLLNDFSIEIASSFGPLKGKIWRIGTMGFSCQRKNVLHVLGALEAVLLRHRHALPAGEAVQAALDVYAGKEGVLC
ncbi:MULTISPECIES: pyridoxal-phosphate-dependent aminotransferase family protein [unclassified Paenibacillus]|uniref:pyridoxal-phosphate-dependent aminotransferase family protein n=1 Tax=unclassified Paenibacillus TaxID=185978 RepID=UPI0009A7DD76|nr:MULTISPECIES: alanine--glyoxylate aminotransferase family protein [unclassified Paenibacillus]SLK09444.1 (S)-ureidoglycine-glyoxylate aminotransferase [Paenibacillus sp. RU5A]SOC71560.1 (S)-ureidoglycine-glyoxylate aminotransferase [Paenibacillus sp. RU26A]SOC73987.1 (S)-ureidoglycine-glyoxylate aminotransferase [Paenibacillus sp. RU5M]